MILCFTSAVFCVDACCAMLCCERLRTLLWLPTVYRPLGGSPMAAVRAVAVLAAGAAGAQGLVLHVLLPALRAGAGVRAAPAAAAAHHAAPLAAARALVAMRTCAASGGAGAHGPRVDVDLDVSGGRRCQHLIGWRQWWDSVYIPGHLVLDLLSYAHTKMYLMLCCYKTFFYALTCDEALTSLSYRFGSLTRGLKYKDS